jgi:hypothetical protein
MTVHWISARTLKRHYAVLACKRMIGSITYDILADKILEILKEYSILDKCVAVVTDNGSNFVKAFQLVPIL